MSTHTTAKLHRAPPDELSRVIGELYDLIEHARDGRNALWRVKALIASIKTSEQHLSGAAPTAKQSDAT